MGSERIVTIPGSLYERLERELPRMGLASVDAAVAHLVRQYLSTVDADDVFTEEEEEQVKQRLRSLGYLD